MFLLSRILLFKGLFVFFIWNSQYPWIYWYERNSLMPTGCWDSRLKSPVPEVQAAISGQWQSKQLLRTREGCFLWEKNTQVNTTCTLFGTCTVTCEISGISTCLDWDLHFFIGVFFQLVWWFCHLTLLGEVAETESSRFNMFHYVLNLSNSIVVSITIIYIYIILYIIYIYIIYYICYIYFIYIIYIIYIIYYICYIYILYIYIIYIPSRKLTCPTFEKEHHLHNCYLRGYVRSKEAK